MKKRLLCVLLAAFVLISLLPGGALAASDKSTSDACIQILKEMEGFVKYPQYDNGQYTVGYGSGCGKNDYPNGISEAEAERLLRIYLQDMEKSLNSFASRYNLTFSQSQYDALILFTYNCGAGWMTSDGTFRSAIINGAKGNDLLYAITLWSTASGKLNINLVKRRLIEADMYLNGSYSNSRPANYTFVVLDANGGICDAKVQGYDSNFLPGVKPIPTRSGYRFLGWYSAAESGSWVTTLTASHAEKTLYAHWQASNADAIYGTAASYQVHSSNLSSLEIYSAPGGTVTGSVTPGTTAVIIADYVDGSNVKWGKVSSGGWVNLGNPLSGASNQVGAVTVTVTNNYINVRSGAGTYNDKVGMVYIGDTLVITETKLVGDDVWGKFSGGWISLMYTNYESALLDNTGGSTGENAGDNTGVTATGKVVDCDSLRVRSGPGFSYPSVGSLAAGTRVEITQQKAADGMTWGKISSGWISLSYVQLDPAGSDQEQETGSDSNSGSSNAGTGNTVTGTVISNIPLNIRTAAGAYNMKVGSYNPGTQITIVEQMVYGGQNWGRTDRGWVCMDYVQLVSSGDSGTGVNGTVTSYSPLNIRLGPGTYNKQVGTYSRGTRIVVYEQTSVNGQRWGRTDRGWVCMDYVSLDAAGSNETTATEPSTEATEATTETTAPSTEATETTETTAPEGDADSSGITTPSSIGTVISYSPLNIRSAPGTYNQRVGSYPRGTVITILEQRVQGEQTWGRTDKGWVCMQYVLMESEGDSSGYKGTVNTDQLRIRQAAGTNKAILGYYNTGDQIVILETVYLNGVAWGRTNKGWVCMIYVDI